MKNKKDMDMEFIDLDDDADEDDDFEPYEYESESDWKDLVSLKFLVIIITIVIVIVTMALVFLLKRDRGEKREESVPAMEEVSVSGEEESQIQDLTTQAGQELPDKEDQTTGRRTKPLSRRRKILRKKI